MYPKVALIAFVIDKIFGEFEYIKKYKHPIIYLGEFINYMQSKLYDDSKTKGLYLWIVVVGLAFAVGWGIEYVVDNIWILSLIASVGISSKMLKDEVSKVIENPTHIKYLVSRDTDGLSSSDINKAAIETYAENLSDGVIAPLFYLWLFGLKGLFAYKAINTLDSMVGYKNQKYKNFGYVSAKVDDIANYIPARLSAMIIGGDIGLTAKCAKGHESPNAGYPICAMAYKLGVRLGGDTKYFGKLKHKPHFGEGRANISKYDIARALKFDTKVDIVVIIFLLGMIWI
jgi:adenosylcobinamide-phosphate synthase